MTVHFLPIPPRSRKRCDTRALLEARQAVRQDLEREKLNRHRIITEPRHFQEHQNCRQTGAK